MVSDEKLSLGIGFLREATVLAIVLFRGASECSLSPSHSPSWGWVHLWVLGGAVFWQKTCGAVSGEPGSLFCSRHSCTWTPEVVFVLLARYCF